MPVIMETHPDPDGLRQREAELRAQLAKAEAARDVAADAAQLAETDKEYQRVKGELEQVEGRLRLAGLVPTGDAPA